MAINKYLLIPILSIAIFSLSAQSAFTLPVFPGAQGFGTDTVAGRGGTVYRVTNLNDSGTGSLRDCVNKTGPRVCIFEISGTIALSSNLTITNPYLTIAGQTAPSPGITLRNREVVIKTNDVLIQHLRFRVGDTSDGGVKDAIRVQVGGDKVVIDHCSVSWATDENISTYSTVSNVTFINCLLAEGLPPGDSKTSSKSTLFNTGSNNIAMIRSATLNTNIRNPKFRSVHGTAINNYIYN